MKLRRLAALAACLSCVSFFDLPSAHAASLVEVNDWDSSNLPNDIKMYAYVPDAVVDNPAIVTLL